MKTFPIYYSINKEKLRNSRTSNIYDIVNGLQCYYCTLLGEGFESPNFSCW